MKKILLIFCLSISSQSMALTCIYNGEKSIPANKYLTKDSLKESVINDDATKMLGLPAKSHLKAGEFNSFKLSKCQKYSTSFFVVGADEFSLEWLKAHHEHLKNIHAFGLITNIDNEKELEKVEEFSPINLIASNVDALAEVVKARFYPFFTNGCEVWQ